ncbi:MAG: carboxylating nicotinate-nucleotide diphosphorylase [Acidobacteria bacterium]|nr:carboxylating nicotinate-nucleotide diphosphorylase [Acidobacteriota bacterium]
MVSIPDVGSIVRVALAEDLGSGDVTSVSILAPDRHVRGRVVAKAPGVVAGLTVAAEVFAQVDARIAWTPKVVDGARVAPGDVVATLEGPAIGILAGERTALNFLQRMSGIATATRAFVDRVQGTGATILDTRKTAPGLRVLDKMAVRAGGGRNHRMGLFDMVLIKDNHIDACGSIPEAVARVRRRVGAPLQIEVECRTPADVDACLPLALDRLLLDNMSVTDVRACVALAAGTVPLEASGNITLDNVREYAETGVAYISVGALTHSVRALDLSLLVS